MRIKILIVLLVFILSHGHSLFATSNDCFSMNLNIDSTFEYCDKIDYLTGIFYDFVEGSKYPNEIYVSFDKTDTKYLFMNVNKNGEETCDLKAKACHSEGHDNLFKCELNLENDETLFSIYVGHLDSYDVYEICVIRINRLVLPKLSLNDIKKDGDQIVVSGTTQKILKYLDKLEAEGFQCKVEKDEENSGFLKYIQKFECKANIDAIWPDGEFEDKPIKFIFSPVYEKVEMYKTITIPKALKCAEGTYFNEPDQCVCLSSYYTLVDGKCVPPACEDGYWDDILASCVTKKVCADEEGYFWDETTETCIKKIIDSESTKEKLGKTSPSVPTPELESEGGGCLLMNDQQPVGFVYIVFVLFVLMIKKSRTN